ncbi:MAG: DUF5060 domain-containing protein [Syntrophobacteraceae bacterium]|jgi:hypothetical protein|nr:DUF5060 domain-containing protein [Syntrophobacteraceae bacterium]
MSYLEWEIENASFAGNPFDLEAFVTFCRKDTGECQRTSMFYDGGVTWRFRFPDLFPGEWRFRTRSEDPDLDGHEGDFRIEPREETKASGFIASEGSKWIKNVEGRRAFVPQYVMYARPDRYYQNLRKIDADIQEMLDGHGFSGFHTSVACQWFDLERPSCRDIQSPDPDPDRRTFEALELLITNVQAAGGVVHIWAWGDDERGMSPRRWGINGPQDRRLQRYIAARLGPIPGWTMGYGFDLNEWVTGEELTEWYRNLSQSMAWSHMLGARSFKNSLLQMSEPMDYSSYEQHKPDYAAYVQTIENRPAKASFSEDRFRVRAEGKAKDYSLEETRRGLWRSAMAGGVANIWGYLLRGGSNDGGSGPYPNKDQIKTYARFFDERFFADLHRCNELTDGVCLQRPGGTHFLFYREDASGITMNLGSKRGGREAVAVDAKRPYVELGLGTLHAGKQTWKAPYPSDWAVAVGSFD